ncbi:MAG: hypothetical protein P4L87_11940 [Formivibrio sp.]|nr:hypothetical protein [Formivibrio sp.]
MSEIPERLSSLQTFIFKFIFPVVWIGGFSTGTVAMWVSFLSGNKPNGAPSEIKYVFLALTIAGSAYIYWSCIRLKRVRMDRQFLYISNYAQEIKVPLSMAESVSEFRWDNAHPVTIHFVRPTEFGSSITFMPKVRLFGFWSSHPVVEQIRSAAKLHC